MDLSVGQPHCCVNGRLMLKIHCLSCKEFNARTAHLEPETPTPVIITIQPDRTFKFDVHTPPTSWLIKQAASIQKGSSATPPGLHVNESQAAGSISLKHVHEIAKIKSKDNHLRLVPLENLAKSVIGTCKSMGEHSFQTQQSAWATDDTITQAFASCHNSSNEFVLVVHIAKSCNDTFKGPSPSGFCVRFTGG